MIYEYAVEPDTVAGWGRHAEYEFFVREFGLGNPRAMSAYPRFAQWRSDVLRVAKHAGVDDLQAQRLTAVLGVLRENKIERGASPYDRGIPWLVNAEDEHARNSFQAVLSRENPRGQDFVIPSSIAGVVTHPLWTCVRNHEIPREPSQMVMCVRNMLLLSRTAVFVDPWFHPGSMRYQATIQAFLRVLASADAVGASRVEIHTDMTKSPEANFVTVFEREMPALTPAGMKVCLRRWTQKATGEKLHDRFVLTNLGAVEFTVGLDKGAAGETTRVYLLDPTQYRSCWKNYVATPAFDCSEAPTVITGTRSA